jgi:hypothetical protein
MLLRATLTGHGKGLAVTDAEASASWYQRVLAATSGHGGNEYEHCSSAVSWSCNYTYWKKATTTAPSLHP